MYVYGWETMQGYSVGDTQKKLKMKKYKARWVQVKLEKGIVESNPFPGW